MNTSQSIQGAQQIKRATAAILLQIAATLLFFNVPLVSALATGFFFGLLVTTSAMSLVWTCKTASSVPGCFWLVLPFTSSLVAFFSIILLIRLAFRAAFAGYRPC